MSLKSSFPHTTMLDKRFDQYVGDIPEELAKYPSMISLNEKRFLYNLARQYYTGEGIIFDAGIFLGASSMIFGKGVSNNGGKRLRVKSKPVHSFDLAVVNHSMIPFFDKHKIVIGANEGESFSPWLAGKLAGVRNVVDLHFGDVTSTMSIVSEPIEIAFLDVLKLKTIANQVIKKVFPLLIPGKSIVIQQDYFHDAVEFIKVYQENFGDYFEYIGEISCSAIFLCKSKISPEIADELCLDVDIDIEEELASIALQRSIDPARRYLMSLSKARTIAKGRGGQAAMKYLESVSNEFPMRLFADFTPANKSRITEALNACEGFCARRMRPAKAH